MDERTWSVMASFQSFLDEALADVRAGRAEGAALIDVLTEHLGEEGVGMPVVRLDVPGHQFVNLDIAMDAVVQQQGGGRVIGIGGGDQRHHMTFGDLLQRLPMRSIPVGPVDRTRVETGPASSREAIAMGVHLFRYAGSPVAVLQRRAEPRFGQQCAVEVLAAPQVSEPLLADVRRLMVERSVFKGQLLSFGLTDETFGPSTGGIAFLERPTLGADEVILPEGLLERISRHVVGTARHRAALQAAHQHLKRGLLLYGPPGTGKTHTVRYLAGQLPEVTTVLLAGNALALVAAATELAHALAPAIVVMEDVDLIAEARTMHIGPQPLLFTLLDAMDGLASEADVAFVLTTNRADLLETALSQRPGRIDLAVEIPLPDAPIRRRLLDLYAAGLPFSTEALDDAAVRCGGVTASFFKELTRRSVLIAADAGVPVGDDVLDAAVQEMLGDSERFTRAVLGGEPHPDPGRGPWGGGPGGGHPAGSGSSGRVRRLRRGFTTYGPE
jgi:hypothetical protein